MRSSGGVDIELGGLPVSPITVLCGPSGSGKTDLLRVLHTRDNFDLDIIRVATTRNPRLAENTNLEYEFVTRDVFLSLLAEDAFANFTEHQGALYGLRRAVLQRHLYSPAPALVILGTTTAIRLKKRFPAAVRIAYAYPGDLDDLRRVGLNTQGAPNLELVRRLRERAAGSGGEEIRDLESWLEVRMTRSLSRVATLLSEIVKGLEISVISNTRGDLTRATDSLQLVTGTPGAPVSTAENQDFGSQEHSNADLPKKRVGATALYVNEQREVLLVKPTYRQGWLTPGGTVEVDESPRQGCMREVREELGRAYPVHHLLCIEYRSAHDSKVENVQFVFWGGILSSREVGSIRLPEGELEAFRFCDIASLDRYLNPHLANRVATALEAQDRGKIVYLENKQMID
jgi:8-oxo-dGTP diphosphatase